MFSPAQIASCCNVNYVVDSYQLAKFVFIDIRKVIKINRGYGYGLSGENLERSAVCMF